jgi:hypothetical protein
MTGYQSKKAAALDEEGMYLVHQTSREPVQRPWVGLTDEELAELSASGLALWELWRAIEAKLKEKNS